MGPPGPKWLTCVKSMRTLYGTDNMSTPPQILDVFWIRVDPIFVDSHLPALSQSVVLEACVETCSPALLLRLARQLLPITTLGITVH